MRPHLIDIIGSCLEPNGNRNLGGRINAIALRGPPKLGPSLDDMISSVGGNESASGGRLPDFLIIGAMKAGTTSLYHYLGAHPEIFMPATKELDFFTRELTWNRGWDWYRKQFHQAGSSFKAVGEASTSYTKFPRYQGVPERISSYLPEVRLIYVVRNPLDRIRSHYQHNVAIGEERRPIDEAVLNEPVYVDYSKYSMQVERYLEHFDESALLIITSENLREDRKRTVKRVLRFVGADPDMPISLLGQEFYRTSERPAYGRMLTGGRRALKRMFPSSIEIWRGGFIPIRLKRKFGRVQESNEGPPIALSPDARAVVIERLVEDVTRLGSRLGGDFDGWGLI